MVTHYKGHRISDLLAEIEDAQRAVKADESHRTKSEMETLAGDYATLALMKAKLTALQGEDDGKKGI